MNWKVRAIPILLFVVFGAIYHYGNQEVVPITGRKQLVTMSRDEEMALGLQSYREVLSESRVIRSGPEIEMIQRVGRKIAAVADDPGFDWQFELIDSEQANAFCLPGGKVAVYSGILPIVENENGLAVVMAHEISHAIARHGAERMAQEQLAQLGQMAVGMAVSDLDYQQRRTVMGILGAGAQFGVLLPFSRKHESEADKIGLIYMSRACFDPTEAPKLWERMAAMGNAKPPEFMSTHPSDERRVEQFQEWMPEALAERAQHCTTAHE